MRIAVGFSLSIALVIVALASTNSRPVLEKRTASAPLVTTTAPGLIQCTASGFALRALTPMPTDAAPVEPIFPVRFADDVRVKSGIADVVARPFDANPASQGEIQRDGILLYRDAFQGCDVMYRCEPLKTEEFIVVNAANEGRTRTFSWNIRTNSTGTPLRVRLTAQHTLEFCDNQGVPRLRINAPEGKDASGRRLMAGKELCYTLDGERLTLRADLRGATFPVVIDPTWSSTGSLSVGRYNHTATRLSSGKVLVAGGNNGGSTRNTCEFYDPTSGTWSATGSMSIGREVHTAILLPSNKVLVAGGSTESGPTDSCEIYDPDTETWTATGSLAHARSLHTTTLLADNTILAIGGASASLFCEIYDESLGTWTSTGNLLNARYQHTATRLIDGRVMVAGGPEGGSAGEIFSPTTGLWTPAGALNTPRFAHSAVLLASGKVLLTGGRTLDNSTYLASSELFDPVSLTFITAGSMANERPDVATAILPNGTVLAIGGGPIASEVYHPDSDTWRVSADMLISRSLPTATSLDDGRVLAAGGNPGSAGITCEILDLAPTAVSESYSGNENEALAVTLHYDSIATPSFTIVTAPVNGTLSGTAPDLVYNPGTNFFGSDSFQFTVSDSFGTTSTATISITIIQVNHAPTVSASATPASTTPGDPITFSAVGMDADGDTLTYFWDFGDGNTSTDADTTHAYSAVGSYLVTVTVTDPSSEFATATLVIHISELPTARFTTDEVVAFVGIPQTFDATYSTDPENQIVSYAWNFGDGTHNGSGQVISKIYSATGSYDVTLTVTDDAGLSSTVTRTIQVLDADQIGLFNGYVRYKVGWNRNATSKDTLQVWAKVNVGDMVVASGTAVELEIVGQHFTGTLDGTLRDSSDPHDVWAVKAHVRNEPFGTVLISAKINHADLGLAFNSAGAMQGAPNDFVELDIPVTLTVGSRVFVVTVPSEFRFNSNGKKGRGTGEN